MRSSRAKRMADVLSYSVRKAAESWAAQRCRSWASSISGGSESSFAKESESMRVITGIPLAWMHPGEPIRLARGLTYADNARPHDDLARRPHLRTADGLHRQHRVRNHHS